MTINEWIKLVFRYSQSILMCVLLFMQCHMCRARVCCILLAADNHPNCVTFVKMADS